MKTFGFITAIFLLGAPVFAQETDPGPVPPTPPAAVSKPAAAADDQENAATADLLTSGPWKVSGPGWAYVRIFDKDGTFHTKSMGSQHGTWKITDSAVELDFVDGHVDTFPLPLHPAGTPGVDAHGHATKAVLLSDTPSATPVPAPPELVKLRQNYVDSLNDLLRQYGKAGNQAGITAVTREINSLSPCGVWKWVGNPIRSATIHPDGTVTENSTTEDRNSKDVWHWTDEINGKFQIDWNSGWVDDITLLPDGNTMLIKSNAGKNYTVHRLPQANMDGAAASANTPADTSH